MTSSIEARLNALDWIVIERSLWERGYAHTSQILAPDECDGLVAMYSTDIRFRQRIDMARHRFGIGEYKYFAAPLPPLVQDLRVHSYVHLAEVADRWMEALDSNERYPGTLDRFLERCAQRGQVKPTPLMLRYERGGYNCLHQDIYGDVAFPLQVVALLSRRDIDYTGGEFLLVEQRPRAQSAAEVITAAQGELVIFTTRIRPAAGSRGYYRVNVRHGVSPVRSGTRYTLGIILHDAL